MIINIEQFHSIEDVYKFIDENAYDLNKNIAISDVWYKYRDYTKSDQEKQLAQWETEFFIYHFSRDGVFSISYSNGKKPGEVKKYPDLDEVQTEAFQYLIKRASFVKNPLVNARYNHLLWKGLKGIKNKIYAKKAIESYLNLIECYLKLVIDKKEANSEYVYQIARVYENVIGLCSEVKSHATELKALTNRLIFDPDLVFYLKEGIIEEMLSCPQLFTKEDFYNVLSIFEQEMPKVETHQSLWINNYLPTAVKVARKINGDTKKWYNEIGLLYLKISENENDESRYFLILDNYSKAITAFNLAKNKEKKLEAEHLYAEIRPKVKLQNISISLDKEASSQFELSQKQIREIAEKTLKRHPFNVYKSLSKDPVLPKFKDIQGYRDNEPAFLKGFTTIYFDNNKNISKTEEGKIYNNELLTTYALSLKCSSLPFFHYIFTIGIKSNHLGYQNFLYYLLNYTWIGKPYSKIGLGGEKLDLNWVDLLAPSIIEYFNQIKAWTNSKYYIPNFTLCIDSLTLKIEGILRNFCERLNIPTTTAKRKGMHELTMQDLLDNELLKSKFSEDDMLLLNYMFSNEGGLNLRNNIAHCFYNQHDYYSDVMLLLIEVILRISNTDPTFEQQ